MIVILESKQVFIKSNRVPEPLDKVRLQYKFEFNTNHLQPKFYIGKEIFIGDRITVDMTEPTKEVGYGEEVQVKVELTDPEGKIIKTYRGSLPCRKFCMFSKVPKRFSFERYIVELEAEIERLKEKGEVV
jgi:hypothetical protein